MRRLVSFLLISGIALLPVYLWESGGAQVSHYLLFAAAIIIMVQSGLKLSSPGIVLLLLAVYAFVRESIAVVNGRSIEESLLPVAYLFYNLVLFEAASRWFAAPSNIQTLRRGLIAAVSVALGGVLVFGYSLSLDQELERAVGTFNNPNQLGYFSVCLISLAGLMACARDASRKLAVGLIAAATVLSILSLSKAAMVSVGFGVIVVSFVLGPSRNSVLAGLAIAVCLVFGTVSAYSRGLFDNYRFVSRLSSIGRQADDSIAGRGYDVLFVDGPVQLLFGRGSSNVLSFVGHEVHSTIVSFFGSYGLIGLLLFGSFILMWAKRLYVHSGIMAACVAIGPPMLYGLTHNGSRFAFFWVMVAYSFALTRRTRGSD